MNTSSNYSNEAHFIRWFSMASSFMDEMEEARKDKLELTKNRWVESRQLPRKMKKKRRKQLKVDFMIYSWNPFEMGRDV